MLISFMMKSSILFVGHPSRTYLPICSILRWQTTSICIARSSFSPWKINRRKVELFDFSLSLCRRVWLDHSTRIELGQSRVECLHIRDTWMLCWLRLFSVIFSLNKEPVLCLGRQPIKPRCKQWQLVTITFADGRLNCRWFPRINPQWTERMLSVS